MKGRRKLIIIFLSGVLLMGLGSGIAFAEFSSFRYGGEKKLDGELATVVMQETAPEGTEKISVLSGGFDRAKMRIETDSSMEPSQISFEITCDEKVITPFIEKIPSRHLSEPYEADDLDRTIYLLSYSYSMSYDGMKNFMRAKDELMECMRERVVYSYPDSYIGEVVIKVAPELADSVSILE